MRSSATNTGRWGAKGGQQELKEAKETWWEGEEVKKNTASNRKKQYIYKAKNNPNSKSENFLLLNLLNREKEERNGHTAAHSVLKRHARCAEKQCCVNNGQEGSGANVGGRVTVHERARTCCKRGRLQKSHRIEILQLLGVDGDTGSHASRCVTVL